MPPVREGHVRAGNNPNTKEHNVHTKDHFSEAVADLPACPAQGGVVRFVAKAPS